MGVFVCPADAALSGLIGVDAVETLSELNYRIVDARPMKEWQRGHLPDAVSLSWENYTETDAQGVSYRRLSMAIIAERLGTMGIDENTPLIVYGDADSSWGGEGWVCWMLSELGHRANIHLLEGGVQAWRKRSPLVTDIPTPSKKKLTYYSEPRPKVNISTAELRATREALQLVDTRSFLEYLKGHIPGAVRINWTEFYSGAEPKPISKDRLVELLKENGINPEKPVVYYCSGGIRSAYAWLVHELAGFSARNYEGGMEAWKMSHAYGN